MATTPLPLPAIVAVAGVTHHRDAVARAAQGDPVEVHPEPDNPADPHALRVDDQHGAALGYVPALLAPRLHAAGAGPWAARIVDCLGDGPLRGLRIRIDGPAAPSTLDVVVAATGRRLGRYHGQAPGGRLIILDEHGRPFRMPADLCATVTADDVPVRAAADAPPGTVGV